MLKLYSTLESVARAARVARVPMSHVPGDVEYLSVLAYRIGQESRACEARIAALAVLAADVAVLADESLQGGRL